MGANGPSKPRPPLEAWELAHLERFGEALGRHRAKAGISLRQLRLATGMGVTALCYLERGKRRTRHSTIRRIAHALADTMGTATGDDIAEELIDLIGPAAAPESRYMRSIERRRDRHVKKLAEDSAVLLRPPQTERAQLERALRLAERELYALRRQRRDVEAKEEELRQREAALERLDKQIQRREVALSQRRPGPAERTA